jgi:hypothetical protein
VQYAAGSGCQISTVFTGRQLSTSVRTPVLVSKFDNTEIVFLIYKGCIMTMFNPFIFHQKSNIITPPR